jgi:hypothetical protein
MTVEFYTVCPEANEFEWKRTYGIDPDGEILVAADFVGDPVQVIKAAIDDGVLMARTLGHVYLPISWICKRYPQHLDAMLTLEDEVIKVHSRD